MAAVMRSSTSRRLISGAEEAAMDRAPVSLSRLPCASAVLERAAALHSSLALTLRVAGLPKLLCVMSNV